MLTNRRILYVQPSELFGGAERQIASVLPRLQERGVAVTALVGPGRTIVDWLEGAGAEDIVYSQRFPRDDSDASGLQSVGRMNEFVTRTSAIEREVDKLIDDRRIDAVVASMAFSWVSATPAARRHRVPVIWRAGGMELSLLERLALPLWARRHPPDALVTNGEGVRDMFAPLIPAPAFLVRNGVDTTLFRPGAGAGALLPVGPGATVGFAARLVPQKRPEDFLQMAARIAARHPDVRFLVAGDGSRRPHYERLAAELGLGDRMRFLGMVQDMRAFYSSCSLLVLPSRSEGSPNVVLEAMAMKLPVVVSDTPATREIVTHMRDGFLFPVGDVDKLTEMVELALSAPDLRATLVARAFRKAQGPLSAETSGATLAGIIETLLDRPRSREADRPLARANRVQAA